MPDKVNGMRVRLAAIVWDLAEMCHITDEGADMITARIESMSPADMAAWVRTLLPTRKRAS